MRVGWIEIGEAGLTILMQSVFRSHGARLTALSLAVSTMLGVSGGAYALDNQWYFGLGGGMSWLTPNPVDDSRDDETREGQLGTVLLGRDFSDLTSVQLQAYSLGDSEFDNGDIVTYNAADLSLLYRFYDTRDAQLVPGNLALAFYGKFAVGGIDRDQAVPVELKNNSDFYFGAGAGVEVFFGLPVTLRAELLYHEEDIQSVSLALVTRFGGSQINGRPTQATTPATASDVPQSPSGPAATAPSIPTPAAVPTAPTQHQAASSDSDRDGVADASDQCSDSRPAYPVTATGCPLLNGILSGVQFVDRGTTLSADSAKQLDRLVRLLLRYPQANIRLLAHTDARGTLAEQAQLTRDRVRVVGLYLLRRGIASNRLELRSMAATRPLVDGDSVADRQRNNRIEIYQGN